MLFALSTLLLPNSPCVTEPAMKIKSSHLVPIDSIQRNVGLLPAEWGVEIDEAQFFAKAADVPQWVSIIADLKWWQAAIGFAASQVGAAYLKEAGKAAWSNQGKIVGGLGSLVARVRDLAAFVLAVQVDEPRKFVLIELSITEHQAFSLRLDFIDRTDLEFAMAIAMWHVPGLTALAERESLSEEVVGNAFLELCEDHSMHVSWMDRSSLEKRSVVLPFGE